MRFAAYLAFPNRVYPPTLVLKRDRLTVITLYGRCELRRPKVDVGLWLIREATPCMSVPEAAIDEDDGAVSRKDDVGPSRQSTHVKPVSKAASVEPPSNHQLRPCVTGADPRHHS
jgi:hypothetical protein